MLSIYSLKLATYDENEQSENECISLSPQLSN